MKNDAEECCCTGKICTCRITSSNIPQLSSPVVTCTEPDSAVCLELQKIIETLVASGKGLLACDESPSSLEQRFHENNIENTETMRRDYREMLLSTDKLSRYISGVILHYETIQQRTSKDVEFVEFLRGRNIVTGVKVDLGLAPLFGTEDEKITLGLDNLREKCALYKQAGCHFTKWRCVFSISERCPSHLAMVTNANILARYASICQDARMVPILEPDILTAGDYDINRALRAHQEVLSILFRALNEHHVYLEGMLLKPAMVLPGTKDAKKYTPQVIAEYTLRALRRTVSVATPAIFFLSGGQTDEESVINLNAINAHPDKKPWRLSFSYGRALQNATIKIWNGKPENVEQAQTKLLERVKLCSEASLGTLQYQRDDTNSYIT